jgi:hypothetical protein
VNEPSWHAWLQTAPAELRTWAASWPDAASAWSTCDRADWLLWALAVSGADRRTLVGATCRCARAVERLIPPDAERLRRMLDAAEAWVHRRPCAADLREGTGPDTAAPAVRSAVFSACAAATPDRRQSATQAAQAASSAAQALQDAGDDGAELLSAWADEIRDLRWPTTAPRMWRWPAQAQVAWDLVAERTAGLRLLTTVEVLSARSTLPAFGGGLELAPIAERLVLAPDLAPEVRSVLGLP